MRTADMSVKTNGSMAGDHMIMEGHGDGTEAAARPKTKRIKDRPSIFAWAGQRNIIV
jgi:hypothetical protein